MTIINNAETDQVSTCMALSEALGGPLGTLGLPYQHTGVHDSLDGGMVISGAKYSKTKSYKKVYIITEYSKNFKQTMARNLSTMPLTNCFTDLIKYEINGAP